MSEIFKDITLGQTALLHDSFHYQRKENLARQITETMKKRNLFLIILIPIFLIGIACILAGIALGGTLFSYQLKTDGDEDGYQTEATTLSTTEAETIRGLDWDIRTSEVKVVIGDSYSISGSGHYKSYVENGIWHVKTKKWGAQITFLSHIIDIPNFWNHTNTSKNTITIPADVSLETANINVAAGTLTGEALSADDVTLKIGAGESKLEQMTAKNLSVKVGAGTSTLKKLQISDSCTAKVGAGEIVLGSKNIPAGTNVIANLEGKCAAGDMTVTGKLTGDARLQCSTGGMDLLLDGCSSNYNIQSEGTLGDINIDITKNTDEDWDFGDDDELRPDNTMTPDATAGPDTNDRSRFGNLSLKCSLGDINVNFQH